MVVDHKQGTIGNLVRTFYSPTAVPGESWIQYSESALVKSLCHFLTASYLCRVNTEATIMDEMISPFLDYVGFQMAHDTTIVIIPPYLGK